MCRRVECSKCQKPSYAGCGAHVEQVLRGVPQAERCSCREKKAEAPKAQAPTERRGWFRDLFGK